MAIMKFIDKKYSVIQNYYNFSITPRNISAINHQKFYECFLSKKDDNF